MTEGDVRERIEDRLKSSGAQYRLITHPVVYTMLDVDNSVDIPTEGRVKTLVVRCGDNKMLVCGIRATGRLDLKAVAKYLNQPRSRIKLLNGAELELATGVPRGAIGPILPYAAVPVILSALLPIDCTLYCGVGSNTNTLVIDMFNLRKCCDLSILDIEIAEQ